MASSSKTLPSFTQGEIPMILCTISLRTCICIWSLRFGVQPLLGLTEEPLLLPAGEDLSIQVSWQSHILLLLKYFKKIFLLMLIYRVFSKKDYIPIIHWWYVRMESTFVILTLNSVTLPSSLTGSRNGYCCSWLLEIFSIESHIICEQRPFYFFLLNMYTFPFFLLSGYTS